MPPDSKSSTQEDHPLFSSVDGAPLFRNRTELANAIARMSNGVIKRDTLVRSLRIAIKAGHFDAELRAAILRASYESLRNYSPQKRELKIQEINLSLEPKPKSATRQRGRPGNLATCDMVFKELYRRNRAAKVCLVSGITSDELRHPNTVLLRKLMLSQLGLVHQQDDLWEQAVLGEDFSADSHSPSTHYILIFNDPESAYNFLDDIRQEAIEFGPFEGSRQERKSAITKYLAKLDKERLRVYVDESEAVLFPIIALDPGQPDSNAYAFFATMGKLSLCEVLGPAFDRWKDRVYRSLIESMSQVDRGLEREGSLVRIRSTDVSS